MYPFVSIYLCVPLSLCVCVSVCMHICLYVHVCTAALFRPIDNKRRGSTLNHSLRLHIVPLCSGMTYGELIPLGLQIFWK